MEINKSEIVHVDLEKVTLRDGKNLKHEEYSLIGEPVVMTIKPIAASEFLLQAEYDREKEILKLELTNGNTLIYEGVPMFVALNLALAKSMGRIYNTMIRGKYKTIE